MLELCQDIVRVSNKTPTTALIVQQYCGAACATNLESIGYIAFGVLEQVNTFT
ncbi:hypothetical protein M404DRAFT_999257, partial [Pisolithus tinctorius Marx 270]